MIPGAVAELTLAAATGDRGRGGGFGPVDLVVPAGTYACLLGPTGAGKSALLRAIAGDDRHGGRISAPAAVLVTRHGGIAASSVQAALRTAAATRPRAARDQRIASLVEAFGLDPAADPAALPPDARLRARLAVALAGDPRLLLLDDVLADCDDRPALIRTLRALPRPPLTVLHALRWRDDGFALADQLVLMEHGRVVQSGTPAALYERPESLAIARRTGEATVLAGLLLDIDNDVARVQLDCGPVVEADPPRQHPAGAGARCHVLLRPERVSISILPAQALGETAIAGLLRDVTHRGDTLRLLVSIGTDTDLVVTRPTALGAAGLVTGRVVSVAWQSRHALTFLDPG